MKAVILGWKRVHLHDYLLDCEEICSQLTKDGYDIFTGGGTGFMEYANKGAASVDENKSFGISVKCLKEEQNSSIADDNFLVTKDFADRKKELLRDYDLIVFFPGGMGTLDEFSEVMNLLKTGELEFKNVILYGYKYWNSLISWFEFNKIKFPMKFVTGIADSVIEFNEIYSSINEKEKEIKESEGTIDEIKNYEPIFTKKTIFNPFDDIDNLIQSIFNNPDMLEDFDFKTGTRIEHEEEIPMEFKINDDDDDEDDDEYNDEDDEDIIIEIIYESSESSNKSVSEEDAVKDINPIDFISESDTSSDKED